MALEGDEVIIGADAAVIDMILLTLAMVVNHPTVFIPCRSSTSTRPKNNTVFTPKVKAQVLPTAGFS
ncbi:MAG: hypothetical protein LBN39_06925 [Planctomycetaceae bacterium]|jgi:hypothetical protein|nr:hypothetical protein [Planctomycetaceae bacterium]